MRKALIYGLTLSIALTLTACGQPKAEEPSTPDPAASAAIQTASPEESTEPTVTPEPSEETPTAPAETDTQTTEDTTTEPENTTPEQTPEAPEETASTQQTEETETAPATRPTTQTTKPNTDQTPPSGENPTYEETEQAMIEELRRSRENLEAQGYNTAHGELTDEAVEAIGSSLSGGTPTAQPDTDSQDGTGQPQTPPDSGSVESEDVRTPAQTAAEDWLWQQMTGGSSDYNDQRDFTDEEIADIGSKLNVTN